MSQQAADKIRAILHGVRSSPTQGCNETPVNNVADFLHKYGIGTLGLLVQELIIRAPDFPGDESLAMGLGRVMSDLEAALTVAHNDLRAVSRTEVVKQMQDAVALHQASALSSTIQRG